jgi:hypothetical protein
MSATSSNSATYPVTDPFWSDILQFGPGIKCVTSESDNGTQFPMVPKRLGDYARSTVADASLRRCNDTCAGIACIQSAELIHELPF